MSGGRKGDVDVNFPIGVLNYCVVLIPHCVVFIDIGGRGWNVVFIPHLL